MDTRTTHEQIKAMCLYSASYHIFSWKITLFKNRKHAV